MDILLIDSVFDQIFPAKMYTMLLYHYIIKTEKSADTLRRFKMVKKT